MNYFDRAFAIVVGEEGVFSTDRSDPGNWTSGKVGEGEFKGTKYGISAAAYPDLDIASLTLDTAKSLYKRDRWDYCGCDAMTWARAICVFDCAVNQGQNFARTLPTDPVQIMTMRAMRYTHSPLWPRDGHGWITRLFTIFAQAQKVLT